jgi:tetratricopeptide (TPR) repeat protein
MRTEWADAEREFEAAIAANPNYYMVRDWHAQMLWDTGRFEQALTELTLSWRLDPMSESPHKSLCVFYYLRGQYDDAIREAKEALRLDPTFLSAHAMLGVIYERQGDYQAAIATFKETGNKMALAHTYAVSGHTREARQILHDYQQSGINGHVSHAAVALVECGLGEYRAAIEALEQADRGGEPLDGLNVEPRFAPLRSDPRFVALLRRHGFL